VYFFFVFLATKKKKKTKFKQIVGLHQHKMMVETNTQPEMLIHIILLSIQHRNHIPIVYITLMIVSDFFISLYKNETTLKKNCNIQKRTKKKRFFFIKEMYITLFLSP
jgi:hypothetical protein